MKMCGDLEWMTVDFNGCILKLEGKEELYMLRSVGIYTEETLMLKSISWRRTMWCTKYKFFSPFESQVYTWCRGYLWQGSIVKLELGIIFQLGLRVLIWTWIPTPIQLRVVLFPTTYKDHFELIELLSMRLLLSYDYKWDYW